MVPPLIVSDYADAAFNHGNGTKALAEIDGRAEEVGWIGDEGRRGCRKI